MATPGTLRTRLMRVMGDGEWHKFSELYYAIESLIAPEQATRQFHSHGKNNPPANTPLESQVEQGKQQLVIRTINGMGAEPQGYRGDRWNRYYRLRPDKMRESEIVSANARQVFRALLAHPGIASFFKSIQGVDTLNPAQSYWVDFALSADEEEETTNGDDSERLA